MIEERFMVTGKAIHNGETVTGWLVVTGHNAVTDKHGRYLRTDYCYQIEPCDHSHRVCVDAESIEPVAVRPSNMKDSDKYPHGKYGNCPNCDTYVQEEFCTLSTFPHPLDYCPYCGQRLDWGDCWGNEVS